MRKIIGILIITSILLFPIGAFASLVGTGSLTMTPSVPTQSMTFPPTTSGTFYADYDADYSIVDISYSVLGEEVYCVENATATTSAQPYDYWTIDASLNSIIDPDQYIEATWLAEWGLTQTGPQTQEFYKAVTQVAIWEVIIESVTNATPYSLSDGNVTATGGHQTAAQTLLDGDFATALGDGTWDDYASYWLLAVNPTGGLNPVDPLSAYQNFLVPNPVPIPSAILIFGSGLVALVGVRRKINKKA